MGLQMSRRLDIESVDAALQRAANKAVGGTREERSGRFQRVQSSTVRSVRYGHDARALDITFVSGKTYRYLNVPLEVYVDFIDAESKGEFFNDNIKDSFVHAAVTSRVKR
jgi:KTSC domain